MKNESARSTKHEPNELITGTHALECPLSTVNGATLRSAMQAIMRRC